MSTINTINTLTLILSPRKNAAIVCANLIIGQLAHRKVGQYQYN